MTAGWTQRVVATKWTPGTNLKLYPSTIYTFEGSGNEMLPLVNTEHTRFPLGNPNPHVESVPVQAKINSVTEGAFQPEVEKSYTVVLQPGEASRKLSLTFSSQRPGHEFVDNKTKYKKVNSINYFLSKVRTHSSYRIKSQTTPYTSR